ncbi:hypothetical protein BH09ACT12_BH09ACT12_00860 [soil metagenome]
MAVAVVREGLTNVGRHARAKLVEVSVTADADTIEVSVLDDGVGPGHDVILSGLANLRRRAEMLGGSFVVTPRTGAGTQLSWSVPLGAALSAPAAR